MPSERVIIVASGPVSRVAQTETDEGTATRVAGVATGPYRRVLIVTSGPAELIYFTSGGPE